MKFTKTLLAASVAVAAVSANAAWVNPAQNIAGLGNSAPVWGLQNLQNIDYTTNLNQIDLGSGPVGGNNPANPNAPSTTKFEIFNYKTLSGADVISLKNLNTGEMVGTYLRPVGNDNKELVEYLGTDIDYSTLTKGGQLTTEDPAATITGDELKVINSEHVIYGYAGTTTQGGAELQGDLITPNGEQSPFKGTLPEKSQVSSSKYVQSGIIGNTGTKGENATDPSKNIYGVSAKDGNNITHHLV